MSRAIINSFAKQNLPNSYEDQVPEVLFCNVGKAVYLVPALPALNKPLGGLVGEGRLESDKHIQNKKGGLKTCLKQRIKRPSLTIFCSEHTNVFFQASFYYHISSFIDKETKSKHLEL
jgi:hypothetical protein